MKKINYHFGASFKPNFKANSIFVNSNNVKFFVKKEFFMSASKLSVKDQIIKELKTANIEFNLKEHNAEGFGTNVAQIHNLPEDQGAKAMVANVAGKFYLAVLPFDKMVDWKAIAKELKVSNNKVKNANAQDAEAATDCKPGSIPPFSLKKDLGLIIDAGIKTKPSLFFNIGSLDTTISITSENYFKFIDYLVKSDQCQTPVYANISAEKKTVAPTSNVKADEVKSSSKEEISK